MPCDRYRCAGCHIGGACKSKPFNQHDPNRLYIYTYYTYIITAVFWVTDGGNSIRQRHLISNAGDANAHE